MDAEGSADGGGRGEGRSVRAQTDTERSHPDRPDFLELMMSRPVVQGCTDDDDDCNDNDSFHECKGK